MSIDHLKKQSKNLKRLWPEFAQTHGASPTLAACQELIARCSGYASWHAATTRQEPKAEPAPNPVPATTSTLQGNLTVELGGGPRVNHQPVEFGHKEPGLLRHVKDRLDGYLETHEGIFEGSGDMKRSERLAGLRGLEALCLELVSDDPDFVDGYAHLVSALVSLNRPADAVEAGQEMLQRAMALIEQQREVEVPYWSLNNRGFHRLAHSMALAHMALSQVPAHREEEKARALAIIEKMLSWWPNDNMGLRFLKDKCKPARKKAA